MSEKGNKILYIILSLLIAIVFWLYVDDKQENTTTQTFNDIPVDFIGAEDALPNRGLMLSDGQNTSLSVTLRGPRTTITSFRQGDVRAQVDLSNINSVGTYPRSYTLLYPDNVDRSSITQERASRYYITVKVDPLYSREIPVSVSVIAPADEKYMYMGESQVEPSSITLSGLAEDVDKVESCRVVVDLTEATGTVSQEMSYELLDVDGNVIEDDGIRVSDRRVMVTSPVLVTKELPLTIKPKYAAGAREENVTLTVEPSSIMVAGEAASLANIEEIVLGEVDLSAYPSDTDDILLEIKLPAGCINLTGETQQASLSIHYHGLETKSFMVSNISAVGLSAGQRFDPITTFVNVQLRGPAEDLELITEDDIRIVVDLTEFANNGSYTINGTVYVDGYSRVGAVGGPWRIACKITS